MLVLFDDLWELDEVDEILLDKLVLTDEIIVGFDKLDNTDEILFSGEILLLDILVRWNKNRRNRRDWCISIIVII